MRCNGSQCQPLKEPATPTWRAFGAQTVKRVAPFSWWAPITSYWRWWWLGRAADGGEAAGALAGMAPRWVGVGVMGCNLGERNSRPRPRMRLKEVAEIRRSP